MIGFGVSAPRSAFGLVQRSAHPRLNLRFFRNPSFAGANVTITLAFFAMSSALFLLT